MTPINTQETFLTLYVRFIQHLEKIRHFKISPMIHYIIQFKIWFPFQMILLIPLFCPISFSFLIILIINIFLIIKKSKEFHSLLEWKYLYKHPYSFLLMLMLNKFSHKILLINLSDFNILKKEQF